MKALVYFGPESVAIEEVPVPVPGEDEILLQVEAVGICGSELEGYLGHSSIRKPPLIMGHEFCGRVAKLGHQAQGLPIGQRVIVNPLLACGKCLNCLRGKINVCVNRQIVGIHRPGAFASYVAVPANSAIAVPDELDAAAASLAEPLAVAIHALKLGMRPLEDVLIYGAGPIGLLCLQAALQMGAATVTVVDLQPGRLAHAARLGAQVMAPQELEEKRATAFPHGIPVIIDCVGVQATREQALGLIDPGGTVVMVGLGRDQSSLPVNHLVRQEISLIGSYTYTHEDFGQAVGLLQQNKVTAAGWSELRSLGDAPVAFRELVDGKSAYSKIILTP